MRHWLQPLPGQAIGCLNCGYKPARLLLRRRLVIGFGTVTVSYNGISVWYGDDDKVRLARFERMARCLPPTLDWRVEFYGPLSDVTYQRQGTNNWVLVKKGLGFA